MADPLMCMLLLSNEFYSKREVNEVSGRQPGEDVAWVGPNVWEEDKDVEEPKK